MSVTDAGRAAPLSFTSVCYALPMAPMAMLWTPLNVMQGIYIKHYGISMAAMATILLASRFYDAIADLAVGAASDWVKARTGKRKTLLTLGAALFALAALCVYIPPARVTATYLGCALFTFFSGYALLMISYLAWGAELARSSTRKTALFSARTAAGYVGLCTFYSIPMLPVFGTSDITPDTLKLAALVAVGSLVPALFLALSYVPEGRTAQAGHSEARTVFSARVLRVLYGNRPFMALMGAFLLCGLGLGIWYGMIFIFVDIYLHQGSLFAPIYLIAFGVGALAALGWNKVAARVGKKSAWSAGMSLALATVVATSFLTPQNAGYLSIGALLIVNTIGFAAVELLPGSILGDVADYSLLRSGHNHSATLFSVYMFLTKVLFALGGAVGLGLAAWLGFDPHAQQQTARGVHALSVVMSWAPAVLLGLALVLTQFIPMNERRHAVIRRRLDQLEARALRSRKDGRVSSNVSAASTA
jgi:Na+/melibiose symporter-like transporter